MSDVEKGNVSHPAGNSSNAPSNAPINGAGQLWDPSHAYAPRQPSRIGNPGALYVPLYLFIYLHL